MQIFKVFLLTILACFSFIFGIFFYLFTHATLDLSALENYDPGTYSVVLDDQGQELTRFQLDRRETITLSQMSPLLIQAFLAAEDHHFFLHHGISLKGIIRSFIANFTRGRIVQGASTITQQLIKLLFLDNSRTFTRKIKELFLAILVERQLGKELILQTYLNHIYLGCGIYGVQAASQRFWRCNADALSLSQAATLAGIVQSPERLCPLSNPERALKRRNTILYRMLKQSLITQQEYTTACAQPLMLKESDDACCSPHMKEMIRQMVEPLVGKKILYCGGLTIQTTLSSSLQKQSNTIFKSHLQRHQKKSDLLLDGGFMIMEGAQGKIKALIGGKDFAHSQFNRVTQAKRQLGSIFKPLFYAGAIDQGARMDDVCADEPITIEFNNQLWSPQNYNHTFQGPVTRAYGLYKSLNTIAIQTLYQAGIQNTIKAAHACGLDQEIPAYPSLALGCIDATLWQAAQMFNCLAHQGNHVEPYFIEWIKDSQDKKIYKHRSCIRPALNWYATSQVAAALCAGVEQQRKKQSADSPLHALKQVPLMTKTGTTNDARSCFCLASTPKYTAAAYIGNDENKAMGNYTFASQTVFPLLVDILAQIDHARDEHFIYHPELKSVIIHEITGKPLPDLRDPHAIEILVPRAPVL